MTFLTSFLCAVLFLNYVVTDPFFHWWIVFRPSVSVKLRKYGHSRLIVSSFFSLIRPSIKFILRYEYKVKNCKHLKLGDFNFNSDSSISGIF